MRFEILREKFTFVRGFISRPFHAIMNFEMIGDGGHPAIALASRVKNPSQSSQLLLYRIGATFLLLLVWASFAHVEDLTRADGRVIPSARLQIVQNLEGGIVQSINVRQGETVESGALLLSLSATQFGADRDTRRQQVAAFSAKAARLRAEFDGVTPVFDDDIKQEWNEFVVQETSEFLGRQARHQAELSVIESQIAQKRQESEDTRNILETARANLGNAQKEIEIVSRLVERGLEPRLELLRLQGKITELEGRLESARIAIPRLDAGLEEIAAKRTQVQQQFRSEAAAELGKVIVELRSLQKSLPALTDKVDRTEVRAPVKGVLNRLFVTTIGGVIKPGEPIAEIVPVDDQLVIEAKIRTQDIGFINPGMKARVKLTAYDYSIFGSMEGVLTQIGADAISTEDRAQTNSFYFLARIETHSSLKSLGRLLPVIPGMQAQVEIITGSKSILTYLLKPLVAVKENAFRER
jgi:adhesin transport system membrane fusion protein